jgi:hypothetical protein
MTTEQKIDQLLTVLQKGTIKKFQAYPDQLARNEFVAEVSIFDDNEVKKIKNEILKLLKLK